MSEITNYSGNMIKFFDTQLLATANIRVAYCMTQLCTIHVWTSHEHFNDVINFKLISEHVTNHDYTP